MNKMLLDIPTSFESERLLLRSYQAGDGAMYFAVGQRNRQHLQPFESGNVILTMQDEEQGEALVRQLAAEWVARNCFFLGAFDKKSAEFVAQIYIGPVDWNVPEFEIGYFVDRDHEGQGYVTEAVRASLAFIFKFLGAHRVRLGCSDQNVRSYRVAERCGFVREAHYRENKLGPGGVRSGEFIYGMLKKEFEQQNADTTRGSGA